MKKKSIVWHVQRSKYLPNYSEDQISDLIDECEEISATRKKMNDFLRYEKKMANIYKENKAAIAKEYGPVKKARKYHKKRPEILKKKCVLTKKSKKILQKKGQIKCNTLCDSNFK